MCNNAAAMSRKTKKKRGHIGNRCMKLQTSSSQNSAAHYTRKTENMVRNASVKKDSGYCYGYFFVHKRKKVAVYCLAYAPTPTIEPILHRLNEQP